MSQSTISFDELRDGTPRLFPEGPFKQCFAVATRDPAFGTLPFPDDSSLHVIAFSQICTHMGCWLDPPESDISANALQRKLVCGPCPCHGTTYDLLKQGLVVLGPATQNLAQVEITGEDGKVKAVGWLRDESPSSCTWPTSAEDGDSQ